jgi:hypothetical protein
MKYFSIRCRPFEIEVISEEKFTKCSRIFHKNPIKYRNLKKKKKKKKKKKAAQCPQVLAYKSEQRADNCIPL